MSTRIDQVNQDDLRISMEEHAKFLAKDRAVLDTAIRSIGGGIQTVGAMQTFWRERQTMAMTDTVTEVAAIGATSIKVTTPTSFHAGEMIFDHANEDMFIVDETVGGTAVDGYVKVRGKSGTGGITSALAVDDVLLIGPHTQYEGGSLPAAFNSLSVTKNTYLFQTDASIKITDIAMATDNYDNELELQRRAKYTEHLERLCLAFYNSIGGREILSSGDGSRTHMPTGLNEYLSSQTTDLADASITLATIGEILRLTTIYGGGSASSKLLIVGQNANNAINSFPTSAVRVGPGDGIKWGCNVNRLVTSYGELQVLFDPLLSEERGMAGDMYILDKPSIKQIQLKGMPLEIKKSVQARRDIHNIEDAYTGTRGLKMTQLELSRRVKNIGE